MDGVDQFQGLHYLKQGQQNRLERHQKAYHQIDHKSIIELVGIKNNGISRHFSDHYNKEYGADRND